MEKCITLPSLIFSVITVIFLPRDLQAQGRRGPDKVKVVRYHHTRLVRVHPDVIRPAHVRYAHLPRWGTVVSQRPASAIVISSPYGPYYFHNGIYYIYRQPGFTIVRPVPGIRIKVLPVGYRRFILRNRPHYYYYGTFYVKADKSDEYEVVDAPEGAIVDALPDGYEVENIGGTEYYVLDGVYYTEVETHQIKEGIGYRVVKI